MKCQAKILLIACLLISLFFPTFASAATVNIETKTQAIIISPKSESLLQIVGFYQVVNRSANDYQGEIQVPLHKDYENVDSGGDPLLAQYGEQSLIISTNIPANHEEGVRGRYVSEFSLKNGEGKIVYTFPTDITTLLLQVPVGVQDMTFLGIDMQAAGEEGNVQSYVAEKIRAGQTLTIDYKLKEDGLEKFAKIQEEAAASQNETAANREGNTADTAGQVADNGNSTTNNVTRNSPSFHSPGHIRLWNTSVLGAFNPHIFLVVMAIIIFSGLSMFSYFAVKRHSEEKKALNSKEEQEFRQLVKRKRAIMEKIVELEEKREVSNMSEEEFKQKNLAYKKLLVQVNQELNRFVD